MYSVYIAIGSLKCCKSIENMGIPNWVKKQTNICRNKLNTKVLHFKTVQSVCMFRFKLNASCLTVLSWPLSELVQGGQQELHAHWLLPAKRYPAHQAG